LAYGVETRSARRLLSGLVDAGLARTSGAQPAPRAGRPQVIYELDVRALLASEAESS
jgi:predicted ArsR family transcriptional regulator